MLGAGVEPQTLPSRFGHPPTLSWLPASLFSSFSPMPLAHARPPALIRYLQRNGRVQHGRARSERHARRRWRPSEGTVRPQGRRGAECGAGRGLTLRRHRCSSFSTSSAA